MLAINVAQNVFADCPFGDFEEQFCEMNFSFKLNWR